jgi:hypothetical protein
MLQAKVSSLKVVMARQPRLKTAVILHRTLPWVSKHWVLASNLINCLNSNLKLNLLGSTVAILMLGILRITIAHTITT